MRTHARALRRQAGLSLMELMIAISIGLFLLVGLVAVFANSNRTYVELSRSAQQIENGRFALQILTDDLANAGFYGRYSWYSTPTATPDPCVVPVDSATLTQLKTGVPMPIQGYDAPGALALPSCIDSANHQAGTDVLVVRRADSRETASGSLVAAQVYLQANADTTNTSNPLVALGTAANFTLKNSDGTTTSPIRKYHVHIYFIAPCSIPNGGGDVCVNDGTDDNGAPIPTLKRYELDLDAGGVLTMKLTPLVEGIENLQVDYGVDTDTDGVPNSYLTVPATVPADWGNVVSVRVNLLARNLEASSGYTDSRSYDMGVAGTVTPGLAYKRQVYNSVIRIVNPSSRRES